MSAKRKSMTSNGNELALREETEIAPSGNVLRGGRDHYHNMKTRGSLSEISFMPGRDPDVLVGKISLST